MLYELFDRITGRTLGTFDADSPTKAKLGFSVQEGFDSVRQLEIARDVALSARNYHY